MIRIEDAADTRLDDYRLLNDAKARRRLEGDEFFITEGPVAIERLIESGNHVRSILLSDRKYERMASTVDHLNAPVYVADKATIAEVVGFDMHRGAVAAANRPTPPTLDDVIAASTRIALLDGLNDAENLGAIARSARALGIDALVIDETCTDPFTRRTVRVSMGEVLFMPVCRVPDWPSTFDALARADFEVWAMTPADTADDIWHATVPSNVALMFGPEGPGLASRTMAAAHRRLRIPLSGNVDSLNVGNAAAVAFAIVGRPNGARLVDM